MKPVWRDYDWLIYSDVPVNYTIEDVDNAEIIYEGIATPKPNEDVIKIRITDFAKNIVNSDVELYLNEFGETFRMENYTKELALTVDGNKEYQETFSNNYDYNNDVQITNVPYVLGSNADDRIGSGMIGKITKNGNYCFTLHNPTTEDFEITIEERGNGTSIFWYENTYIGAGQTKVFVVNNVSLEKLLIDIPTGELLAQFDIVDNCNDYNLHYINAAGGYSTIGLEGKKGKRSDNFNFEYYKTIGNNSDYQHPQTNKFKVDITSKWELQTGWLTDTDSQKMYNIFGSQRMLLEDNRTGKIYPVYITNTVCDYKTFTNQGKKKYNYTISLTCANTIIKL